MQPGYLLLPKKHSFRGITNIRVVFFLRIPGGAGNSGFADSRQGKRLAFLRFFTQFKDSYSSFIISCTNFAQCSAAFFSKVG